MHDAREFPQKLFFFLPREVIRQVATCVPVMEEDPTGLGVKFHAIAGQFLTPIEDRHHGEQQRITGKLADGARIPKCPLQLAYQTLAFLCMIFGLIMPLAQELGYLRVVEIL